LKWVGRRTDELANPIHPFIVYKDEFAPGRAMSGETGIAEGV
jgi:hypothetical protein